MGTVRRNILIPFLLLASVLVFVTGCSDPEYDNASQLLEKAGKDISRLETLLKADEARGYKSTTPFELPNIKYLKEYAHILKQSDPDLSNLIATLEAEGTVRGGSFTFLRKRLTNAQNTFANDGKKSRIAVSDVASEAASVSGAADPTVFNDSLVDVINVLADMSKGKLPKLKFAKTEDQNMPPSQHLVGNPTYGYWSNSGGSSFWQWYGQYRLFSDIAGWGTGYQFNRDRWYRNRSASYYGDVGRHYYGTDRNNRVWANAGRVNPGAAKNKVPAATVKKFKSSNRLSSYAPKTANAPKAIKSTYSPKRVSSYSNSRTAPSSRSGFRSRSLGK